MTNAARRRHQDSSIDEYHNHIPTYEVDAERLRPGNAAAPHNANSTAEGAHRGQNAGQHRQGGGGGGH